MKLYTKYVLYSWGEHKICSFYFALMYPVTHYIPVNSEFLQMSKLNCIETFYQNTLI